jgi:hypothetical protein
MNQSITIHCSLPAHLHKAAIRAGFSCSRVLQSALAEKIARIETNETGEKSASQASSPRLSEHTQSGGAGT